MYHAKHHYSVAQCSRAHSQVSTAHNRTEQEMTVQYAADDIQFCTSLRDVALNSTMLAPHMPRCTAVDLTAVLVHS